MTKKEIIKMSKGSNPRPIPNPEKFRENWDKIFPKKEEKK